MEADNGPDSTAEQSRGQGDLLADKHRLDADLRLIRRAIRGGWNVPRRVKHAITRRLGEILEQEEPCEISEFIQLGKLAATLDSVDLKTEAIAAQKEKPHAPNPSGVFINVNGGSGDVSIRHELLNDPQYLEFQRQRAIAEDADAGAVRQARQPGALENGSAPDLPGPSTNGHH